MKKLLALNLGVLAVAGLISSALHAQAEAITIPAAAQAIINQYAAKGINLCVGAVVGVDGNGVYGNNYLTLTKSCSATPIANSNPNQYSSVYALIKGQWVPQGGMGPVDQGNICNQNITPFLNKNGGNFGTGVWTPVLSGNLVACENNCNTQEESCNEKCPVDQTCVQQQCGAIGLPADSLQCISMCATGQGNLPLDPACVQEYCVPHNLATTDPHCTLRCTQHEGRMGPELSSPCIQACEASAQTCEFACRHLISGYCSSSLSSALNDSNFINSLPPLPAPAQQQQ